MLRIALFTYSTPNDCSMLQRIGYRLIALDKQERIKFSVFYNSLLGLYINNDKLIEEISTFDVLMFQRIDESNVVLVDMLMSKVRELNHKIVVIHEIDDMLFSNNFERNYDVMQIYGNGMPTICSTMYLAEYIKTLCPRSKVYLARTKLPFFDTFDKRKPFPRKPLILHTGTSTHGTDLEVLTQDLDILLCKHNDMSIVFWGNDIPQGLHKFYKRVVRRGFVTDYNIYLNNLYDTSYTMLIHPLTNTRLNRSKTAIKYLETGATFNIGLFPSTPEYEAIVVDKRLIVKEGAWLHKIDDMLCMSKKELREIANNIHEDVITNWTLKQEDLDDYMDIIQDCVNLQIG